MIHSLVRYGVLSFVLFTSQISGYLASKSWTLCIRRLNKTVEVIQALSQLKIHSFSTRYRALNLEKSHQVLRKMAIQNAIQKAKEMAQHAGSTLGKVQSILELPDRGSFRPAQFSYRRPVSAAAGIRPGAIKLNLALKVVFALKD